jgi:hypothetical protein
MVFDSRYEVYIVKLIQILISITLLIGESKIYQLKKNFKEKSNFNGGKKLFFVKYLFFQLEFETHQLAIM